MCFFEIKVHTCSFFIKDIFIRSSLIYNASARQERHECDTSDTSATVVQHKATLTTRVCHGCYMNDKSAARVKNFDFVTASVKTFFHTLIFTIWQMRDYKEMNNFILRTTFWKYLFSIPKCV